MLRTSIQIGTVLAILAICAVTLMEWNGSRKRTPTVVDTIHLLRGCKTLAEKDIVGSKALRSFQSNELWDYVNGNTPQDRDLRMLCVLAFRNGDSRFKVIVKDVASGDAQDPVNRYAASWIREKEFESSTTQSTGNQN
jgi:hypothetical protein